MTDWRSYGDVPFATWEAELARVGSPLLAEARATWEAARPHSALALAMAFHESKYGTVFRRNSAANRNALNLRPRGRDGFQRFGSWADGVAEWRARVTDADYAYAPTETVAELVAVFAPGFDDNDEAAYVRVVEGLLAGWPREGRMETYAIAGLAGKRVALPVPLFVRLIPATQKNQRPGIRRQTPGVWVQHETANVSPGADAEMHCRWLHGGAGGQQLSFHFAVDDRAIYQMIPVDEVTWQAADGGGPGNMSGISCELCVNAGIDHAKARRNAEALAGGVLAALGMKADRVKKHQDFSGKWCPTRMLNENYWPTFVRNVGAVIASGAPVPAPVYVTPGPKPGVWTGDDVVTPGATFYAVKRRVQARAGTRFRRFASPTSPESRAPATGFELLEVEWAVQGAGGAWWWITDEGHRVLQAETTASVVVTKR